MKAPERISVGCEVPGEAMQAYYAWITGFEDKDRDVRGFGYFEGIYFHEATHQAALDRIAELEGALRAIERGDDSIDGMQGDIARAMLAKRRRS